MTYNRLKGLLQEPTSRNNRMRLVKPKALLNKAEYASGDMATLEVFGNEDVEI